MIGGFQRLLVAEPGLSGSASRRGGLVSPWGMLGAAGLLFVLVGWTDIILTWYPLDMGTPPWEFATITASLNGLPGPTIGMGLLTAALLATRKAIGARVVASVWFLGAVLVLAAAALYATNIPAALQLVPSQSLARAALQKAMLKTAVQCVFYPLVFIWIGIATWRESARTA